MSSPLYDLIGIATPDVLNGWTQNPIEGHSFALSFHGSASAGAEFAVLLDVGHACALSGTAGWQPPCIHLSQDGAAFIRMSGSCTHLDTDRTQMNNLADEHPDKLQQLKDLWFLTTPASTKDCHSMTERPSRS